MCWRNCGKLEKTFSPKKTKKVKDLAGIEPATIRSAVERSTTELQIQTEYLHQGSC